MQKIKIRLPATITNFGPGIHSLGLAVSLYVTVEISKRDDTKLMIDFKGEGRDTFTTDLENPVILGMSRLFQHLEKTMLGINIRITNHIPLNSGLGTEMVFMVAGVLGANDLLGYPYNRDAILELAARFTRNDYAVTTLRGGLTASFTDEDHFYHRSLPVMPFEVIIAAPVQEGFHKATLPQNIPTQNALNNLIQIPLFLDALRTGDFELLLAMMPDHVYAPQVRKNISGYGHVAEMAQRAGAVFVTPIGDGPALLALAQTGHQRIAEDMRLAFQSAGIEAKSWVLPVDTQGVVISAVGSI